jgi:two-component system, chemotaxis family, chemotaxis protein CheY
MTKVLLVDDSLFFLERTTSGLEKNNYTVIEAHNGYDALELYKSAKPDIVILDMLMPGIDGLEVLNKLFLIDKDVKIIVVTGLDNRPMIVKAIQQGALDFVFKPTTSKKISSAISKVLKLT